MNESNTGLCILLVSDHYPPYFGGAHRQTHLLGRELSQRGHQVSVVTPWQPGLPEEHEDDAVHVYRLKELRTLVPWLIKAGIERHHPPYPDPITVWKLRRIIRRLQPDLVHSHGWFSYSAAAALLGMEIPLLISARDYGYSCATRTLLHHNQICSGKSLPKCVECAAGFYGAPKGIMAALSVFLGRPLLIRKVKGIHSVSAYVQSIMGRDLLMNQGARFDFNGGTVAAGVISSFLINDPRQPDAEFLQALPTTPYILFVGGLQPRKGLGTLLEAYQQLKSPPPLVLIGYASKDTPVSYPPGVYEFRNVSHPNVMAAWERSCFGVMPSVWPDPSPGVVREAMSKGKAVIGTNVGGTPEMLIDGKTGLLAPPDDAGALAQAMQRLIDQPMLREQLGRAAKEHATVFLSEVSVPRFEKLYRRLVKRTADSSETCHSPLVQTQ